MKPWNWLGSRWWKFDFHSHTPASIDYGKGLDQIELKKRTPEEWLLDFMRAGIDCVAITDHNSGAWIDSLKTAYQKLESVPHQEFRPIHLFPGVELSVNGGIHILGIFDLHFGTSDIDSLLGAVGFKGSKGDTNTCTQKSGVEVIQEIVTMGGIAIPAHCDELNGLFVLPGATLSQIFDLKDVFAMELCSILAEKPQIFVDKKLIWSEVLGSDSHHPVGEKSPGSHFCWIKMGKPCLEGLRLALLDGNLSIHRSDSFSGDPNTHGSDLIEGYRIENAKYLGRVNPLYPDRATPFECNFNPWLNTIIGGRGTGKSSQLEFLRLAMRRQNELPESLKSEFKKYSQASESRKDENLLTKETKIWVTYRKDNTRFRIQWSHDGSSTPILEEDCNGDWKPVPGEIEQRFRIRMYSQKQIFELSKQPQALLKMIDDASEIGYREWLEKWDFLQKKYFALRSKIREVESGLSEESRFRGELEDVKRKLAIFETAGHSTILKDFQKRQRQARALEQWEEQWKDNGVKIRELGENLFPENFDPLLFDANDKADSQLLNLVTEMMDKLKGISRKMSEIAKDADTIRDSWNSQKKETTWEKTAAEAKTKYQQLQEVLKNSGAGDPGEYGILVQQQQTLEEKLKLLESRRKALEELRSQGKGCLSDLFGLRQNLTKRRSEFISNLLLENAYVQIKVIAYGNTSSVEDEFRQIINRQSGFERDIGTTDEQESFLGTLYEKFNPDSPCEFEERLEALKGKVEALYKGESGLSKDNRFAVHVQKLPPENLDRLTCWFPEDSLEVTYCLRKEDGFKPIQQGSPGQKTAALLAFLLAYGKEPLILDQPEDDLDNHLIYDLIVNQVRQIKQKRQIIVVTHNANIVVNGDAEMIMALEVRNGQTHKICEGSLQDEAIRKEICTILEGGRIAFEKRYQRILAGGKDV